MASSTVAIICSMATSRYVFTIVSPLPLGLPQAGPCCLPLVAAGIVWGLPTIYPLSKERAFGGFRETSVSEWDREFRLVRIHHEHREEFCRVRFAGIGANAVAVAGQFGETLPGLVGRHGSVV